MSIYKRRPQESELRSWKDSLAVVADVADSGLATDDVGVVVEYIAALGPPYRRHVVRDA